MRKYNNTRNRAFPRLDDIVYFDIILWCTLYPCWDTKDVCLYFIDSESRVVSRNCFCYFFFLILFYYNVRDWDERIWVKR